MTTVAPNPYSPYATAHPDYRHIFAAFSLLGTAPSPGALVPAACDGMTVVPEETLRDALGGNLPDGLCPDCVTVVQGGKPPKRPSSECGECGAATWHGAMCAVCRQERHEEWWLTRKTAQAAAETGE